MKKILIPEAGDLVYVVFSKLRLKKVPCIECCCEGYLVNKDGDKWQCSTCKGKKHFVHLELSIKTDYEYKPIILEASFIKSLDGKYYFDLMDYLNTDALAAHIKNLYLNENIEIRIINASLNEGDVVLYLTSIQDWTGYTGISFDTSRRISKK